MEKELLNGDTLPLSPGSSEMNNIVPPMECEQSERTSIESRGKPQCGEVMKPQESAGDLPNGPYVYRQDIVRCNKYEGMLGVVMEVAGDSDSDGSVTDDSDIEDDEEVADGDGNNHDNGNKDSVDGDVSESLTDGQVRVMWIDGSETTNNLVDLTVVEREFLHGDEVASISNPTGQLGLVLDVNISVDLLSHTGEVIKNVSSRDLKRVRDFTAGDHVVLGPWLGRVEDVLDNVTVLFDDGSVCKVLNADPLRLKPVSKNLVADAGFPYYPGQRVRAVSSSVFKTSRWLSGLWKANRLEGTVTKVQAGSVVVHWITSANPGTGDNSTSVPLEEQSPKNLTLLSCFSHANWQLGDWCLLPPPQLPPSSSADRTSEFFFVEDATEGCSSDFEPSKKLSGEHKHVNINCGTESSGPGFHNPDANLEDRQVHQILNPAVANENGTCKSSYQASCNAQGHLDSGCLVKDGGANSLVTEKLNATPYSCDANDSMNIDGVSHNGSTGAEGSSEATKLDSCRNSSLVKESNHESWLGYRKKLRKVFFKREKKAQRREETFERALFIANIMTKVDVAWQDGTKEFGLDSKSLIPIQSPGDHEFFPEQYVVEKTSDEGDESALVNRVGVVRSMDAKERTACVRWCKPVSRPEDPREFDNEEVVSAYELDEHPDYDYRYGDLVVRLSPFSVFADVSTSENPDSEQEDQTAPTEEDDESSRKKSGYEVEQTSKDESDLNVLDLSWVGHITGLQDGDIEVTWADGMVSKVGPQAVDVVDREDEESLDGGSEVSDDAVSWETVEENEMAYLDAAQEEADLQPPTDNNVKGESNIESSTEDNDAGRNGPLAAAFDFVTKLATGLFSRGGKQIDLLGSDEKGMNQSGSVEPLVSSVGDTAAAELISQESDASHDRGALTASETGGECSPVAMEGESEVQMNDTSESSILNEMDTESTSAYSEDGPSNFKHFDIAKDPLDHYFLGGNGQITCERKWVKKVQKEWSILTKNLPDAIYVRVFEDRMDLLRAVIVGACGTPYQDGLFFFDFHLSPEYPEVPPTAYYHSGGLRINPNLYEDGKVCLSLLNTWTGKANEVWDPTSSSILQVLVSLQGLVLNSRPYFNEAGYEKQVGTVEGEKNSLPYNENTFLLNLRSMLYLLRRPPMQFEEFVKDHFRRCGHYILKACDAYMKGCQVGSLTKDACMTDKSREHPCSVGFKLMLAKIMPKLILALSEVGADCHEFEHLQNS